MNEDELPWQEVPLHSVIKLSPKAYGCQSELIKFDVSCVSTHRPKPDAPGQLDKRLVLPFPIFFSSIKSFLNTKNVNLVYKSNC